ncbi:MAG: hypothetical protein ACLFR0_04085 [Alphaproteobacteria bacterium]
MNDIRTEPKKTIFALWALLLSYLGFVFLPSLYTSVLSSDVSILVSFAERVADGMQMSKAYYDPNPPMSMLIYVPVVWIARLLDLELYRVHFFYSGFFVLLSFGLSAYLMRRMSFIDPALRQIFLMLGLFGLFVSPSIHFGDRDHLIICGLLPFILVQICLLKYIRVNKFILVTALLLGTLGVLIKPHYGLLPTLLLAWRFWQERDWRIVLAPDFMALASGVIAYAIIIALFFSDYLTVVLPDVLSFYISLRHPIISIELTVYSMLLALVCLLAHESRQENAQVKPVYILAFFSFIMLVVFAAQGKGLNYHRIPYLVFFYMAASGALYLFVKRFTRQSLALIFSVFICALALVLFRGMPKPFVTHLSFKELPLSLALEKYCPDKEETCRYFFYHDVSETIHQLAIYHDAFHASRFTSLWFLPVILINENLHADGKSEQAKYTPAEIKAMKERYTQMIVNDFQKMKPDVLLILSGEIYDNRPFEFIDYFSYHPGFVREIQNYEQVDAFTFKRDIYYPGFTTPFSGRDPETILIYKRQEK